MPSQEEIRDRRIVQPEFRKLNALEKIGDKLEDIEDQLMKLNENLFKIGTVINSK